MCAGDTAMHDAMATFTAEERRTVKAPMQLNHRPAMRVHCFLGAARLAHEANFAFSIRRANHS